MSDNITNSINSVSEILKTVPEAYDNIVKPVAVQAGNFFERIPRAINAALAPLDIWITKKEYSIEETKKLLAQKLENVNPKLIVPPEPYVAIPALQAIAYSMDSAQLREMYATLLANSMRSDKKDDVHPSFVEMIKQMSPLDAKVYSNICARQIRPIISIICGEKGTAKEWICSRNITWISSESIEAISVSLNNLQRNALISLDFDGYYATDSYYDIVRNSPLFLEKRQSIIYNHDSQELINRKGIIYITDFGNLFYEIVLKNALIISPLQKDTAHHSG